MPSITTDNTRYQQFLAKFSTGVFSAAQIDYIAWLASRITQDQSDYIEIKSYLTDIMASAYTDTDILTFEFADVVEDEITINATAHTVAITVPALTDVTELVTNFTLSTGAIADIAGTAQVSGTTENDFTDPVTYTITAQDRVTTQDWTVTVTVAE